MCVCMCVIVCILVCYLYYVTSVCAAIYISTVDLPNDIVYDAMIMCTHSLISIFLFLYLQYHTILCATVPTVTSISLLNPQLYSIDDNIYILINWSEPFIENDYCINRITLQLNIHNNKHDTTEATYITREQWNNELAEIEDSVPITETQTVFSSTLNINQWTVYGTFLDIAQKTTALAIYTDIQHCETAQPTYIDLSSFTLQPQITIDTIPPTLLSITTRTANGIYHTDNIIDLYLTFNKPIIVSPDPYDSYNGPTIIPSTLLLNTDSVATYIGSPLSDRHIIAYRYVIQQGDEVQQLDIASIHALQWNDQIFYTDSGIGWNRTAILPYASHPFSLASTSNITIQSYGIQFPPTGYDKKVPPLPTIEKEITTDMMTSFFTFNYDLYDKIQSTWSIQNYSSSSNNVNTPTEKSTITETEDNIETESTSQITQQPVQVQLSIQLNHIFNVDIKTQSFMVDFLMLQQWNDERFISTNNWCITNTSIILNKIWIPQLTFINNKKKVNKLDTKVVTCSDGTVKLYEHYIGTFLSNMYVASFPFDEFPLYIDVRSSIWNHSIVSFIPLSAYNITIQDTILDTMNDISFTYSSYEQGKGHTLNGILSGYDVIRTTWKAKRITSYNTMNILFPLTIICCNALLTYLLPFEHTYRVTLSINSLIGTMLFSNTLTANAPPVTYATRMTYYLLLTYMIVVCTLCFQFTNTNIRGTIKDVIDEEKKKNDKLWEQQDNQWKMKIEPLLPHIKQWMITQKKVNLSPEEQEQMLNQTDIHSTEKEDKKDEKKKKEESTKPAYLWYFIPMNMNNVFIWEQRMNQLNHAFGLLLCIAFIVFVPVILCAPMSDT